MTTNKKQETAETACRNVEREIDALLKRMNREIECFKDAQRTWGQHGSLERLRSELRDTVMMLIMWNSNGKIEEDGASKIIDIGLAAINKSAK